MKGLIRKEWYSLWSQYRIHMMAMLGLGVLLPIIKNTDFFPDESFWIYCAVITIFYILMHSVEYEKKIKLGYVQSNISNQWKGDCCFKIYLWFWDRDNREYLSFCRKYDLPEDDSGQNQYLLYWSCCKSYMD